MNEPVNLRISTLEYCIGHIAHAKHLMNEPMNQRISSLEYCIGRTAHAKHSFDRFPEHVI